MIRHEFHDCDENGMPQTFKQALRREIRRRQIEADMAQAAKVAEAPSRPVIDIRELVAACTEVSVACIAAAPVACAYVCYLMLAWA